MTSQWHRTPPQKRERTAAHQADAVEVEVLKEVAHGRGGGGHDEVGAHKLGGRRGARQGRGKRVIGYNCQ